MRNPGRTIRGCLMWLAAGAAMAVGGIFLVDQKTQAVLPVLMISTGGTIAFIALCVLGVAAVIARRKRRLRAGHDLIARWVVPPDQWRSFVYWDQQRNAEQRTLMNMLTIRNTLPEQGIEILVGRRDVIVDGFHQSLRRSGFMDQLVGIEWVEGWPSVLLCHFLVPSGRTTRPAIFRFPVPDIARADGIRVFEHFRDANIRKPPIALRNPNLTITIALGIAAVSGPIAAWGLLAPHEPDEIALQVIGVVCAVLVPFGLLLALFTWLLSRGPRVKSG